MYGEKDVIVSGVPKLNKVETCEDVRAELYTATFEISPLKYSETFLPISKLLVLLLIADGILAVFVTTALPSIYKTVEVLGVKVKTQ